MKKLGMFIFMFIMFIIFVNQKATAADVWWHAGNVRPSAYGVKATILTPNSPPFMFPGETSVQSHWVSTSGPYWLQVGWIYNYGWSSPSLYYEYCTSPCLNPGDHDLRLISDLDWNSYAVFDVHLSVKGIQNNTWCALINNITVRCQGNLVTPPVQVQALSEVHNHYNEINTYFSSVSYQDSSRIWHPFDYSYWSEHSPFIVFKYALYEYQTYREDIFLFYLPCISYSIY